MPASVFYLFKFRNCCITIALCRLYMLYVQQLRDKQKQDDKMPTRHTARLMLGQCLRRWINIKQTVKHSFVFDFGN